MRTSKKRSTHGSLRLTIHWDGPYSYRTVIDRFADAGNPHQWDGKDYGVYQIYGKHIIAGSDALLYLGRALKQTFARRFKQHSRWLTNEWAEVAVYLGRIYEPRRHTWSDRWASWEKDLCLAERIMIHKYSPHYNSASISRLPDLDGVKRVVLKHQGKRHKLKKRDVAPADLR